MRYWFDTEFHEDGRTIDLISIGIVAEDGRTFHAVSADYDLARATAWLRENVLAQLLGQPRVPRQRIRSELAQFIGDGPHEIWAYFGEYDWIALRQLFGDMLSWPQAWPLCHLDLEQWRLSLGALELPVQTTPMHHALNDAMWTRDSWQRLRDLTTRGP